jgi:hypothetical protein
MSASALDASGFHHLQNTWAPSAQVPPGDDEFMPVAEGWDIDVVQRHLVAITTAALDGDRTVRLTVTLPGMSGDEIEGLLSRVRAAVKGDVT